MAERVSLREFARRRGWNPGYAHRLKERGRLVMVDGQVDVEASERLLAESADPARAHRTREALQGSVGGAEHVMPDSAPPLSASATFNTARTASQVYDAKLRELQYRQRSGSLIDLDEAKRMAFTAFRMLRDAVLNVPARVKDRCAAETDPFRVEELLDAELLAALESIDAARVFRDHDDSDE